ncbi:MAG: hypothetical protein ACTHOE_13500 [Conexibacter sp.]
MTAAGRTSARRGAPAGPPAPSRPSDAPALARPLRPGELAWLLAVPCAALTLLSILALGPFVGDTLLPHSSVAFFEPAVQELAPEPHEQGRFLVALLGPLLLAGATIALARGGASLRATLVRPLVWAAQTALIAFAVVCLVVQRGLVFAVPNAEPTTQRYFTNATLIAAALGAAGVVAAVRSMRLRALAARLVRETPARRVGWTLAAALLIAVWQLHAFNTEGTVFNESPPAAYHLQFTLDETFAVLNGRTPLVSFIPQYGSLLPYLAAGTMALLGSSVGVFTGVMCLISALSLLAIYDLLRRLARSSLSALLLFAPFLATSWFLLRGPLANRYTLATIFADYPIRFAGPWLLAWLTARQLDRAPGAPRARTWPLFLAAGLVAINNVDHGIPALGALVAALLWTTPLTRSRLARLAREAAIGLLAAYALVALVTLARAGALPDLTLLLRFARLYAAAGFAMLPMPRLGLHTLIYVTFAAALAVATVRALRPDAAEDRALTGMLAFVAVFGLGSGAYYAGRSHPEVLVASFAAWSLALALLTLLVVRELAARAAQGGGWPEPAAALCLLAFCVAGCSLAQTPTPWGQLQRLRQTGEPLLRAPAGQPFVAAHVRRGEHVAILLQLGHRIAENVHVTNVSPYTTSFATPAVSQLQDVVRALRREGGTKVFVPTTPSAVPDVRPALTADGFGRVADDGQGDELWVDGAPPAAAGEAPAGEIGNAP